MRRNFNKILHCLLHAVFIFLLFFCGSDILLANEDNLITERFYSESGDGEVGNGHSLDWSIVHDATLGEYAFDNNFDGYITAWTQWNGYIVRRGFFPFLTSDLPDKAIITNVYLYLMPKSIASREDSIYLGVVQTTQDSITNLTVEDYNKCGNTNYPIEGGDRISVGNQLIGKYSQFILNDIGKSWISKTGYTKLGIRFDLDMENIPPTNSNETHFVVHFSESPGTTKDPYLEVTYYIPDEPSTKIDPVILIPGIMGSWEKDDRWQIDPILHTYDALVEAMINNKYDLDDNLFLFPYNWRQDNGSTSKELMAMINDIKGDDGGKVDIVAHSMGGLVARSYIQSDDYADDVDQVIFLGTPHQGAVEDYLMYEGGYMPGIKGGILKFVFMKEALKNNYGSFINYVRDRIPSVSQLLPVYDYLYDKELTADWNLRIYPVNYPENIFLEDLNIVESLDRLENRVKVLNIYSTTDTEKTINSLKVVPDYNVFDNKWWHGYPEDLYKDNENCLVVGPGDGTVPEFSHNIFSSDLTQVITYVNHREIVTKAQQEVIKELTGSSTDDYYAGAWPILNRILFIKAYSPIDIMVINPDTNKVGANIFGPEEYNDIAGAFYSGGDDPEFITIPEPVLGDYQVIVYGQDNGFYELGVDSLNNSLLENKERLITGIIGVGKTEVFDFIVNEDSEIININKIVDFNVLSEDLDELYDYGEINKQNKYEWLKLKFNYLQKLKIELEEIDKYWLEKIIKMRIGLAKRLITWQLGIYLQQEWISDEAHKVLIQDLDFFLSDL